MNAAHANTRRHDSDDKAAQILMQETKAAAFDDALAVAKEAPKIAREHAALKAENAALKAQADRPVHVTVRQPAPAVTKGTQPIDPVLAVGSAAVAEFLRFTRQVPVADTMEKLHPGDRGKLRRTAAKSLLVKSSTNPAETANGQWAADLVNSDHKGWVSGLETVSIYGAIVAAGGRPLPMGDNQNINYAMRGATDNGSMAASFVGEKATIPVKQGMFASQMFGRKKAGLITVASNELWSTAVEDLRTILLEMITEDTGVMLDSVILDPTLAAQANIRPASPWFNAPNQASGGTDLDSILADIAWLVAQIDRPQNPLLIIGTARELRLKVVRDQFGWVFRDEMDRGTILGIPYVASVSVPTDQVYIIDARDFVHWTPPVEIDMSQTATLAMADDDGTDPTMAATNAITDPGSIHVSDAAGTTPPTQVRGMYQTDSTALRVIQPIEWGTIRSGRTAYLNTVAW